MQMPTKPLHEAYPFLSAVHCMPKGTSSSPLLSFRASPADYYERQALHKQMLPVSRPQISARNAFLQSNLVVQPAHFSIRHAMQAPKSVNRF